MSFQDIKKVEIGDFYIDLAFRRAKVRLNIIRQKVKGTRLEKSKITELAKIDIVKDVLSERFDGITRSFPSLSNLSDFYKELVNIILDRDMLKKNLSNFNWAAKKIKSFHKQSRTNIQRCQDLKKINSYRREFYGRVCSVIKQIKKSFTYIEEARKEFRKFPVIKEKLFTVCIFGFPNTGKTTLLSKLSKSKPEINTYPFTTKGINIGFFEFNGRKTQLLDTPGTLNRFDKMNNIEKQAFLALKHCADLVVYVFDLTEPYPVKMQEGLYNKVKNKDTIVYLSKTDILDKDLVEKFSKKYKAVTNIDELKKILMKKFKIKEENETI